MENWTASGSVGSSKSSLRVSQDAPRKVMFFGKNMSRTRCTGGLVNALRRHDLDVRWLNMATLRRWVGSDLAGRWAEREFATFEPDLVFVFCRDIPLPLLRKFRNNARIVLWIEDLLDESDESWNEYLALADLVCMTAQQPRLRLRQRALGNVTFTMSGFCPRFHYPAKRRENGPDVAFIGGPGWHGQRANLLAEISRHFDTEIFGVRRRWERWLRHYPGLRVRGPVRNRGYRSICANARIVLGFNEVNNLPQYFSNRTFLTLASGGFHLTHHVPGIERVFENGKHLAWYEDPDDCVAKIRHYLSAPEERQRVAQAGHDLATGEHQYYHRVGAILEILAGRATGPVAQAAMPAYTRDVESNLSLVSGGR